MVECLRKQGRHDIADEIERQRARLAEAMAEIRRLEGDAEGLDEIIVDQAAVITRLRARIAELETAAAITFGTLAQPTDDEPAIITHDIPPNAPR